MQKLIASLIKTYNEMMVMWFQYWFVRSLPVGQTLPGLLKVNTAGTE